MRRMDRRRLLGVLGAGLAPCAPAASVAAESLLVRGQLKSWRANARLARLAVAFQFLERPDLASLPVGRHVIDAKAYAMIDKTKSQVPRGVEFEAHRKYIDVHYMIAGQVVTGFAPANSLTQVIPYQEKTDEADYAIPASYIKVKLYPGDFAVFFPGGAHLPNCHLDGPHELHKVVVKVEHDYGMHA